MDITGIYFYRQPLAACVILDGAFTCLRENQEEESLSLLLVLVLR